MTAAVTAFDTAPALMCDTAPPSPPLLSVCIPSFNRAPFLERLLARILDDTGDGSGDGSGDDPGAGLRAHLEILISDNASEDDTQAICETAAAHFGPGLRLFRQERNIGATANLQFLIDRARGRYCVYLADDDILFWPGVLEALRLLSTHPDAIALYAPWNLVDLVAQKVLGQFYAHPELRVFSRANRADFADFVLAHEVFAEIAIYRTDYLRQIVPLYNSEIAFWAFTVPAELMGFGEVIFSPTPFYGSVTRHPGLPARQQAGHEEVQIGWDRYRGGLEHLIGLAAPERSPTALEALRRKADRMVESRMLVGLRLRLAEGRDPVGSYLLAARLRGLGRIDDLPMPFDLIRQRAAVRYFSERIGAMHAARELILCGAVPGPVETLVRESSLLPVRVHAPGETLCADQLVLILGPSAVQSLPEDLSQAAHVFGESDLLAKFP